MNEGHQCTVSTLPSIKWSVKHTGTGLWSSGYLFNGVMNHASLFGSLMGKSGSFGYLENIACLTVTFGGGIMTWGCFSGVGIEGIVKVNLNASAY